MIKKQEKERKTLPQVMKEYDAVFSISIHDGFANVEFNEKGDATVQFLNDEGYATDGENYQDLASIQKVAKFMEEMKELRLKEYEK